jgi:hypothetical protein
MSTLKDEIRAKFHLLDKEAQQELLNELSAKLSASISNMSWDEWLVWARDFRMKTAARHPEGFFFNSVDALNEAREERLRALTGED